MKVKFNNLIPDKDLAMELTGAYMRVMTSGQYIGGKEVEAFEKEWADYCQAKYCVSCGSGQSALELLLRAYGIGYGDEVIVPAWTAPATWKAVINVGAILRPFDVDYDTMLMGPNDIMTPYESERIKAIVPVHLYGYRNHWYKPFSDFLNVPIIEDACQAHGLKNTDLGNNRAWSFYPTKNLGAYGDGGAITTDDKEIADTVRDIRDSSRLDSLQAAFLRVKLGYLDDETHIRYRNSVRYDCLLYDKITVPPASSSNNMARYHQYVIRSKERDKLKSYLLEKDIETMIHYPLPLTDGRYPNADRLSQEVLSLPITCSQEQVEYVCKVINEFYSS